jgi:hypothetical protein
MAFENTNMNVSIQHADAACRCTRRLEDNFKNIYKKRKNKNKKQRKKQHGS